MKQKIEITKIEKSDLISDNSFYEFKIPYEHEDDYGNKGIFFRKEVRLCSEYDEELKQEKQRRFDEQEEFNEKETQINKLKGKDEPKTN